MCVGPRCLWQKCEKAVRVIVSFSKGMREKARQSCSDYQVACRRSVLIAPPWMANDPLAFRNTSIRLETSSDPETGSPSDRGCSYFHGIRSTTANSKEVFWDNSRLRNHAPRNAAGRATPCNNSRRKACCTKYAGCRAALLGNNHRDNNIHVLGNRTRAANATIGPD